MHQARVQVADVTEVDGREFFAALVESQQLEVRGGVVQPGHALGRSAPRARRNNYLESAEMVAGVGVLAAVVEPENAQGENAVDDGGGFCGAHADHGIGRGALQQSAADIGRAEAVLEIHGRAQAVDLRAEVMPRKHALEQALVVAAGGVAGSGSAALAGGDEFKKLRPGRAHLPRGQAQGLRAWFHVDHGANQVALVAPELEQAAPVRLFDGAARGAHVEQSAAIFKESRGRMGGKIRLDCLNELRRRNGFNAGTSCNRLLSIGRRAGGHGAPLPPHALAQAGDVRDVVARVPIVDGKIAGQSHAPAFGMDEALLEVIFRHGLEQADETRVQCVYEDQRAIDGQARVGQARPGGLVVGLDGGPILGERELEADKGIGVAVGEVMHHLANGPAAVAIGRVELRVVEAGDRRAQTLGKQAQSLNVCGAHTGQAGGGRAEASDGIAKFVLIGHGSNHNTL